MKHTPVTMLNVSLAGLPVGKLALRDRRIWFQYDAEFLGNGLELSPFKLSLKPGVVVCEDIVFDGLFGLFNDSLPDGWGRLLLDRHMRSLGIVPDSLTVLDRLAYAGKHGMGALTYEPDYSEAVPVEAKTVNLDRLAEESRHVIDGEAQEVVEELLSLNGSSSGARPKVMVGVSRDKKRIIHGVGDLPAEYEHWIVKFTSQADSHDSGAIEYAYSLMAKAAGVNMPETHLFPAKKGAGYFGVKRFDRTGNKRIHMHTVSGLLHADHRMPSMDYGDMLKAALVLTKSMVEVEAFFRIAVFNVFAHNRDDHAKNFSFLMDDEGAWRTAPAYDLTFSSGVGGEHSTMVMGEGKAPDRSHLRALGKKLGLKKADELIEQVADAVTGWRKVASKVGADKAVIAIIEKRMNRRGGKL